MQITERDLGAPATVLSTISAPGSFGEDMAFDGTFIWRADVSAGKVQKINPADGSVVSDFAPGFSPLGVAWDGAHLWVSEYVADGVVKQFDTAGNPTGNQFVSPLAGKLAGGLAYDLTDGTLWIGTTAEVVHCTATGVRLGSFSVPTPDGRFVDGLEFQGVPQKFDNSLWLGTDNTFARPVLDVDRAGHELRRVNSTEATGIAIDPASNRIFFGTSGLTVTSRDLVDPGTVVATLNPAGSFGEDMAFDGTYLWRADVGGGGNLQKINPADGSVLFQFNPGFAPLGVAWDGSHLWVSQFTVDGLVKQFDTAGNPTGPQFTAPTGGKDAGGLAWDPTDGTLWIGTFGEVIHCATDGTRLGSFAVPEDDGRFVDGLEFQSGTSLVGVPGGPRGSKDLMALTVDPNPFRNSVRVSVQLARPAALALEVFNVKGNRIAILANGQAAAGSRVYRWDARDARGRRQPAGVYWVKATVDGRQLTRSVTFVR